MNNIYRTNFDQIKESYQHIFEALERAFRKFGIDYYLIGAQIKDILRCKRQHFTDGEIDQMYKVRDRDDDLVLQLKLISETIKGIDDPNNLAVHQ